MDHTANILAHIKFLEKVCIIVVKLWVCMQKRCDLSQYRIQCVQNVTVDQIKKKKVSLLSPHLVAVFFDVSLNSSFQNFTVVYARCKTTVATTLIARLQAGGVNSLLDAL